MDTTTAGKRRILQSERRDSHDLAATLVPLQRPAETDWRRVARYCAEHQDGLTDRELDFIINIARWRGDLTTNQQTKGNPNADFRRH
jgi:hypothetical protein